jgi:hypothetical protein
MDVDDEVSWHINKTNVQVQGQSLLTQLDTRLYDKHHETDQNSCLVTGLAAHS